jgi:hypothetical protein
MNTTTHTGRIIDSETQSFVGYAKVTLEINGNSETKYSDNEGIYKFNVTLKKDKALAKIRVDAKKYQPQAREITIYSNNEKIEDFLITPITEQAIQSEIIPQPKDWINWGDHPFVVAIGVIAGIIAIFSTAAAVVNNSNREITQPQTRSELQNPPSDKPIAKLLEAPETGDFTPVTPKAKVSSTPSQPQFPISKDIITPSIQKIPSQRKPIVHQGTQTVSPKPVESTVYQEVKVDLNIDDRQLMQQAWFSLTKVQGTKNINDALEGIQYTNECIRRFQSGADKAQTQLEQQGEPIPPIGRVSNEEAQSIHARGALNDTASCLFIQGELYRLTGQNSTAINAYKQATKYSYARTWDEQGWFWAPANKATEQLQTLGGS